MPDVEANETAETLDSISFGQIAHSVYALFYNKRFGLILILVAGLLSLFGVIFPQMPSGVRDNPEAYASWLDNLRGTYGGWTNIMVNVGLFSMFSSTVFWSRWCCWLRASWPAPHIGCRCYGATVSNPARW